MTDIEIKGWKDLLITGALMSIIGLLMIIFRAESLDIILFVFGILLLVGGAINAFIGIKDGSTPEIISGAIKIVLGIAMIILTATVRDILMVILAIGLIIVGVTNILGGVRNGLDMMERILPLVVGIAFLVVGIYAFMNLNSTADVVMIIIGIVTLVGGLLDLYDAYRLKSL